MSYVESALETLKSKFAALTDRFKHLSWRRQNLPSSEVKVEPARRSLRERWLFPDEEHLPATAYPASSVLSPRTGHENDDGWNSGRLTQFDNDLWNMGRMLKSMEHEMNALLRQASGGFTIVDQGSLFTPWVESQTEGKYRASVPLGADFQPEDVQVILKDGLLILRAKREKKDDNYRYFQEVFRQLPIPKEVHTDQLKAVFTPEGYLALEAPVPQLTIEHKGEQEGGRELPVEAA